MVYAISPVIENIKKHVNTVMHVTVFSMPLSFLYVILNLVHVQRDKYLWQKSLLLNNVCLLTNKEKCPQSELQQTMHTAVRPSDYLFNMGRYLLVQHGSLCLCSLVFYV